MKSDRKKGIKGLAAQLESDIPADIKPTASQKSITSPMNSPGASGTTRRIQRMYLPLPVTNQTVECDFIEIDPDECVVTEFNKRIQSLLDENDPKMEAIIESIKSEGQRDPVLVRPLTTQIDGKRFELIYGSRRRFSVSVINRDSEKPVLLKAWFSSKIPDVDAKRMAHAENEDREDISSWEQAIYIQKLSTSGRGRSQESIAEDIGIDRSTVSQYLVMASLPEQIVAQVISPSEISLNAGVKLARDLKKLDSDKRNKVLKELETHPKFDSAKKLHKAITELTKEKVVAPSNRKKTIIRGKDGLSTAEISRNRNNQDHYKIDLKGVDEAHIHKLISYLNTLL